MAGEVPPQPERPQGRERDVVLTMWEWGGETGYIHDEIASDKRDPRVNAGGPVYGVEFAGDKLVWVDPNSSEAHEVSLPVRDTPGEGDYRSYIAQEMPNPSFYYGDELIWNNPGNPHNPMMDAEGRVWMTHQIRGPGNPDWCREGSDNPFAQYYPIERAARHVAYYDPANEHVELIDTCFNTHHLQFGFDEDDTLYLSSVSDVIGWVNTKTYAETGDEQASQGWCPTIVDTTGDGRVGEWTGLREDPDPAKDRQLGRGWYGIVPIRPRRTSSGPRPPESPARSCASRSATTRPRPVSPSTTSRRSRTRTRRIQGYSPRGIDIDRNGVVWTALSGSGHVAKFDRSQCAVLSGPTATGQHCPRGGRSTRRRDHRCRASTRTAAPTSIITTGFDQFNTLGLGENVPIATGSTSDSLLAFLPEQEEFVIMRVPYPLGFYSRGLDGRIDDPDAGWKGRAVWADYGTNAVWHIEGGKGTQGNLVKFQVRPHPLAH